MISGDTGIAHLASAYGTPSVVLFGPVDPAQWGPPADGPHVALAHPATRRGDRFVDEPDPALLAIGVEEVLAAAAAVCRSRGVPVAGGRDPALSCRRTVHRPVARRAAPSHPAQHARRPDTLCDSRHRTPLRRRTPGTAAHATGVRSGDQGRSTTGAGPSAAARQGADHDLAAPAARSSSASGSAGAARVAALRPDVRAQRGQHGVRGVLVDTVHRVDHAERRQHPDPVPLGHQRHAPAPVRQPAYRSIRSSGENDQAVPQPAGRLQGGHVTRRAAGRSIPPVATTVPPAARTRRTTPRPTLGAGERPAGTGPPRGPGVDRSGGRRGNPAAGHVRGGGGHGRGHGLARQRSGREPGRGGPADEPVAGAARVGLCHGRCRGAGTPRAGAAPLRRGRPGSPPPRGPPTAR